MEGYVPHANYLTIDNLIANQGSLVDVVGDANAIPLMDGSIDAVLCLELLEHLQEPDKCLNECFRVLASGGQLFVTVPFGIGLHMAPHDYYRFTENGLRYLFQKAGFNVIFVKPLSGHFSFIGDQFRIVALELSRTNTVRSLPLLFLFGLMVPALCFYADKLDKTERFSKCYRANTLGYACYCTKAP